jgi:hypothetical protein
LKKVAKAEAGHVELSKIGIWSWLEEEGQKLLVNRAKVVGPSDLVLPRLGYGWLGSAFDGLQAVTKLEKPSRDRAAGL